jgi:signal transduction histidine kinase
MSIKRYLFTLIGGIVLGVAAIQLLLISLFKQHLNEEIVSKSQQLSTNIIDLAVETMDFDSVRLVLKADQASAHEQAMHQQAMDEHDKMMVRHANATNTTNAHSSNNDGNSKTPQLHVIKATGTHHVEQSPNIVVHTEHELEFHDNSQTTTAAQQVEQQRQMLKRHLHHIIEQKHNNDPTMQQVMLITRTNDGVETEQTLVRSHAQESVVTKQDGQHSNAIQTLTNYMTYLILASAVLALLLALWLSEHFTHPLQKLSQGFVSLEQGQFGVQIEEAGINEYRKTMHSFNQMSSRLSQLAQSEKMLQQQGHLAELGEVSRGLAHALRNPMHTIGLSVEQLKDPDLPEKLRARLQDKIQAKIKHIDKTIKALLTLTSGEIHRDDDVPVRSVIQDIMLELKTNEPNVKISFNKSPSAQIIKGAESEIRAIIHTLMVNAVEANGLHGEVTISLSETTDSVVIQVTDEGKGIDSAVAGKLFEPHVSSKAEGAGMGLYISNRLATLYYQGSIALVDKPPQDPASSGCIATVTLNKGLKS